MKLNAKIAAQWCYPASTLCTYETGNALKNESDIYAIEEK